MSAFNVPMPFPPTLGVILAGGVARRMGGGDKPLLTLKGRTLLDHVSMRLAPQCQGVLLNANGDISRFSPTGLTVVPDTLPDHPGPLAGILAALEWAAVHRPSLEWVVSVPGDTPFVPKDLVQRLREAREAAQQPIACASSGSRLHFAVGLWPTFLRQDLHHAVSIKGIRSVREWAGPHGIAEASWPVEPFDPFFNINTPQDLALASRLAEQDLTSPEETMPAAGRNGERKLNDRA